MATLLFAPEVDKMLDELETTSTQAASLGQIHSLLDLLENDPSDARCRRRRFAHTGCWAMSFEAEDTEWLILWEEGSDATVIVRAIVPTRV